MAKARTIPQPPGSGEPSLAELQEAMVFVAYAVERYGDVYEPILSRLEREIEVRRRQESPRDRARRILETYTLDGGVKAIR